MRASEVSPDGDSAEDQAAAAETAVVGEKRKKEVNLVTPGAKKSRTEEERGDDLEEDENEEEDYWVRPEGRDGKEKLEKLQNTFLKAAQNDDVQTTGKIVTD
jgi:hypothetical protein